MTLMISTAFGIACSTIFFLFGHIDLNMKYLLTVIILDYLTGLCRAILKKKLNSSVGLKGIFKKFCYFVIVAVAVILGNILDVGNSIRNLTIYSLIFNELISILENLTRLETPMPTFLVNVVKNFKVVVEKQGDNLESNICNTDKK